MSPPRLRIAVLNRNFSPTAGGAERYSIALVEQLAARHELHVFAQAIAHDWPGVIYHRVPGPLRPRWINQLWFALYTWWASRRGFDVVHSHENTWHGNVQTVHVRSLRVGLFYGRQGWGRVSRWVQCFTSPRLWCYLALERSRYRAVAGRLFVAASHPLRDELEAAFPGLRGHTEVLSPGVRLDLPGIDKAAARAQFGLPESAPVILFVGNDYEKKGLPALLAAFSSLPGKTHLLVVGNAAHIPPYRAQTETVGIADRVHFVGALADVRPAYFAADVLAHPTTEDTFAMVVLEAMACGLPVVVSGPAHCGIAAALRDEVDALILPDPGDADALRERLARVIGDAALRAALAAAGAAFAAKHDWEQVAARQEAMYLRR